MRLPAVDLGRRSSRRGPTSTSVASTPGVGERPLHRLGDHRGEVRALPAPAAREVRLRAAEHEDRRVVRSWLRPRRVELAGPRSNLLEMPAAAASDTARPAIAAMFPLTASQPSGGLRPRLKPSVALRRAWTRDGDRESGGERLARSHRRVVAGHRARSSARSSARSHRTTASAGENTCGVRVAVVVGRPSAVGSSLARVRIRSWPRARTGRPGRDRSRGAVSASARPGPPGRDAATVERRVRGRPGTRAPTRHAAIPGSCRYGCQPNATGTLTGPLGAPSSRPAARTRRA